MRTILLAACILMGLSTVASAQLGFRLEFYADEALSSCELAVNTPGIVKIHMVVTGPGKLDSIWFKAPKPACMTNATWLTDVWPQPPMNAIAGNTQGTMGSEGVDVVFFCSSLPKYVGSIWYSVTGPAQPCCSYTPLPGSYGGDIPYPGYLYIIAFSACPAWSSTPLDPRMTGKGLIMNADQTCRCDTPLAVQSTTWGAVKALYH